jgi:hypothetical protein
MKKIHAAHPLPFWLKRERRGTSRRAFTLGSKYMLRIFRGCIQAPESKNEESNIKRHAKQQFWEISAKK